ncbi:MAG: hypothetical protein M1268_03445 [Patescibacteria group bacterium]|nr:hypothetical protein [Patescibacteria group bacterium]
MKKINMNVNFPKRFKETTIEYTEKMQISGINGVAKKKIILKFPKKLLTQVDNGKVNNSKNVNT